MYSCTITVLSKKHNRGAYWKRGAYWDEGACLIGAPSRTGGTYKGPKIQSMTPHSIKGAPIGTDALAESSQCTRTLHVHM